MGWGAGGPWGGQAAKKKRKKSSVWGKDRTQENTQENDGMGPYGRPAENGMPPEPPLWHGKAGQPVGVEFDPATGRFTDGYKPGPGDRPQF